MSDLGNIIITVVLILIFLGLCVLEFFLARKERKIYGLILPIASFVFALLILMLVSFRMNTSREIYDNSGEITEVVETVTIKEESMPVLSGLIYAFTLANIPTFIFLLIFFVSRGLKKDGIKKNKELEKMNIIDLE